MTKILTRFFVIFFVTSLNCFDMCSAKQNIIDISRQGIFNVAVLRNHKPVVVYFTKSSCRQCATILSDLETVARANDESMYLARVDLDKHPELRKDFGIVTVPTTRTYFKGKVLRQIDGLLPGPIRAITNNAIKYGKQ